MLALYRRVVMARGGATAPLWRLIDEATAYRCLDHWRRASREINVVDEKCCFGCGDCPSGSNHVTFKTWSVMSKGEKL